MFYAFTLDSVFKVVLPKSSEPTWQNSMLNSYLVLLIYVNETIYLYGNLPFFKIQVNRFMARDDPPGANIISKCMLWLRVHPSCPPGGTADGQRKKGCCSSDSTPSSLKESCFLVVSWCAVWFHGVYLALITCSTCSLFQLNKTKGKR